MQNPAGMKLYFGQKFRRKTEGSKFKHHFLVFFNFESHLVLKLKVSLTNVIKHFGSNLNLYIIS